MVLNSQTVGELRVVYDEAIASGQERFEFHGQPLPVDYAKYLLSYLENEIREVQRYAD